MNGARLCTLSMKKKRKERGLKRSDGKRRYGIMEGADGDNNDIVQREEPAAPERSMNGKTGTASREVGILC